MGGVWPAESRGYYYNPRNMTAIEYLRGPNIRDTFITVLDLNPDQVHSIDAFFLRRNPSVQTLVWFVQSASEQSLFQKGDGHPENTDWTK